MSGDVKSEIISAIAKTEDSNMKVVLLMLLGVLDEISGKIDKMRADEEGLRAAVLNGHAGIHDKHHDWVEIKIKQEEEEAKADKESGRRIRDEIISKVLWVALALAAGVFGWSIK